MSSLNGEINLIESTVKSTVMWIEKFINSHRSVLYKSDRINLNSLSEQGSLRKLKRLILNKISCWHFVFCNNFRAARRFSRLRK